MPEPHPWWEKVYRLDAVLGIAVAIVSGLVTVFTATRKSAPELTSLGWLIVAVIVAFVLVLLIGLAGWVYNRWIKQPNAPGTRIQHTEPSRSAQAEKLPVSCSLTGNIFTDPFNPKHVSYDEQFGNVYAEELILRITANSNLENAHVEVLIKHGQDAKKLVWTNDFRGSVNRGVHVDIPIVRREFFIVIAKHIWGLTQQQHDYHVRRLRSTKLFFETDAECVVNSGDILHVSVTIFHKGGPDMASFSLDIRDVDRPLSRLTNLSSNVSVVSHSAAAL